MEEEYNKANQKIHKNVSKSYIEVHSKFTQHKQHLFKFQ